MPCAEAAFPCPAPVYCCEVTCDGRGLRELVRELGMACHSWAKSLGADTEELRATNEESIRFIADLRARYSGNAKPIRHDGQRPA